MITKYNNKRKYFFILFFLFALLIAGGIFIFRHGIFAAPETWIQSTWSGGATSNTATHPSNATNWTEYSSKDSSLTINGSGDAQLLKADNISETTDADFNSYFSKDSTITVTGDAMKLLKANGDSCTSSSECQSNNCSSNLCAAPFVCGNSVSKDSITYGTVTGEDGRCWLDRNLGATQVATSQTDTSAYGWYFEWGRPVDGHQIKNSSSTTTKSTSNVPGHGNYIYSTTNPWEWRAAHYTPDPWNGVNGINNPCPSGFRLPTDAELTTLSNAAGLTNAATAYSNTVLKIPSSGYRAYNQANAYGQLGTVAYLWNFQASYVYNYCGNAYWSGSNKQMNNNDECTRGNAVRCIRD